MGAEGHIGGRRGRGGDILYRWGNPQVYRRGTHKRQKLFHQHDVQFVGNRLLLFNNGRVPDRYWSTIDEIVLPESEPGVYRIEEGKPYGPDGSDWQYGPRAGRAQSFYC